MPRIFAYISHHGGMPDETAGELAVAARRIDDAQPPTALVTGWGPELDAVCESLRGAFPEIWKIANESLAYPNAELVRPALVQVLPKGAVVLASHSHFATDLAPGLSIKLGAAYVPDILDLVADGNVLGLVRQEFGGQVSAHVRCDISGGAVITVRPGAFHAAAPAAMAGEIVDRSALVGPFTARRRFLETIVPEAGDVDITKYPVLVSVGRGIEDPENISIAQELADAVGGAVSCSRPVVDAKWMEKSRQVGSSGKTVKPKVYLACGISGSFQHMAGVQGNALVVAINKNPKAPIFRVADVGINADILEFLPELTARIRER